MSIKLPIPEDKNTYNIIAGMSILLKHYPQASLYWQQEDELFVTNTDDIEVMSKEDIKEIEKLGWRALDIDKYITVWIYNFINEKNSFSKIDT